jgi:uncharacterized protein (DUF305 family)
MLKRIFMVVTLLVVAFGWVGQATHADGPIEGRAGRAEVRFLEGMIDHHQMALDMANHCLGKASTESLLALCQAVIDAQSAEIELMQGWLLDWYNIAYTPVPMVTADDMGGMDHGGHNTSDAPREDMAMMMGMMAGFDFYEGAEYEVAWLESMIDHHDDALHMSERVLERASHPELIELANNIITAQTAEIEQMETMILEIEEA